MKPYQREFSNKNRSLSAPVFKNGGAQCRGEVVQPRPRRVQVPLPPPSSPFHKGCRQIPSTRIGVVFQGSPSIREPPLTSTRIGAFRRAHDLYSTFLEVLKE